MKLVLICRDRDGNAKGTPARRVERLELESECSADLETLAALARVLSTAGETTAAAVWSLLEPAAGDAAKGWG